MLLTGWQTAEPFPLLEDEMSASDSDDDSSAYPERKNIDSEKAKSLRAVPFGDMPTVIRSSSIAATVCPESVGWSLAQHHNQEGQADVSTEEEEEDPIAVAEPECIVRSTMEVVQRLREMRQRIPFHMRGVPTPPALPSSKGTNATKCS
jgi:hypothetical protein